MEIEDHGKERRNALLVSAAVFSAAFLHLRMPSFIADFVKLDIPADHAHRAWLLAVVLTVYTLMRYHFSDTRVLARTARNASFSQVLDAALSITKGRRMTSSVSAAYENWRDECAEHEDSVHANRALAIVGRRHFEAYDYKFVLGGIVILWRIQGDFWKTHSNVLEDFSTTSTSLHRVSIGRRLAVFLWALGYRVYGSKGAWEINTVYIAALAAISACLARAYSLPTLPLFNLPA